MHSWTDFAPNVPVPILAGALAQLCGPANVLVGFAIVAFLGNVCMLIGSASSGRYGMLLLARTLMGVAYESIDCIPIGLVHPRFPDNFAVVVGFINGANRLGSALCDALKATRYRASTSVLTPLPFESHCEQFGR